MTTLESTLDWYLAQVKPNSWKIALRHLEHQGFVTFCPEDQETRRRNGAFTTELRPVFPGYLFVAIDGEKGAWRAVNSTRGVTRLVSFGLKPASVPRALIVSLRQRYGRAEHSAMPEGLSPGDRVRLATGPFAGFLAEIEKAAPDRRVWVLMDILGAQTRVATQPHHLRST
ncbi:transcription termination/antitermination protein NusG [Aliiruegeria sabulilitoris]|uniref:transcription termination/antitermination protein NusG n=1 Tax=Aliiruegeria sabulilitoris TaxID=1510458 RepID=UPI000831A22A|nr:transcription termination/antitermination NusG family protein [Aliiruegeria sabulilitoris]NDR56616.1 transcriptional activator RfaH [Pseudoruegeria sp. M32A2M]